MRLRRRLHAAAIAVGVAAVARGSEAPGPRAGAEVARVTAAAAAAAGAPAPAEAPDPVAAPPTPAETSPAPTSPAPQEATGDVPDLQPSPPRFAVAPFENRSGVRALDWLIAGAPFEISEKTEDVLGLEPTGGALHVGNDPVPPIAAPVAAFGAARDASWVLTGWVERPSWQLRISIAL